MRANVSLKNLTTFRIDVLAKCYTALNTVEEAIDFFKTKSAPLPHLILGGGSNILFTQPFEGTVIKNNITGITVLEENDTGILVKAGAGENWHHFVMHCIENNYAGIENLSLIPGNVGASPMQNIGAYGVEVKDVIEFVEALDVQDGTFHTFSNEACAFGYRSSIFKTSAKGKYMITAVGYRLHKTPTFHTAYGAIQEELSRLGIQKLSIKAISQAVCNIRRSKLPDPKVLGNAGSFFKNPVVNAQQLNELKSQFANIPYYPQPDGTFKLAAGWMIEQCGWKGKRVGNCGVHNKQALVLVNYGGATGEEIHTLSERVLDAVLETFNVQLEREVNIV
jgi:UDP-N-acetylmuramate dehydrogenase